MANGGTQPMTLAFVFPGQGSQSVGMLAELGVVEPVVRATFAEACDVLGYDLWTLCQDGPEADLGATERTQPAMLAAGVATWRVWVDRGGPRPVAMAHTRWAFVDFASGRPARIPPGVASAFAVVPDDDPELRSALP